MRIPPFIYQALLSVVRALLYLKRVVVAVLGVIWRFIVELNEGYKRTVGFRIYKVFFRLSKRLGKHPLGTATGIREWLTQRPVLEFGLLVIFLGLAFPHTRLFTEEYTDLPGRGTLLYAVVGPGDQNFELVEDVVAVAPVTAQAESWREGSVSVDPTAVSAPGAQVVAPDEVSGLAFGGTAVTKPTIIPGAETGPAVTAVSPAARRAAIVLYEVRPGDVLGSIARSYGVSVETILWANNLTARSLIRPGDVLRILPVDGVTHKVARGDTISTIAKRYGAKMEDILSYNALPNSGGSITAGMELIIPYGKRVISRPAIATKPRTPGTSSGVNRIVPPPSLAIPAGSGYVWPTAATIITQYFGLRHTGLDIAGKTGTPVYAARAGQVAKSQCGWNGGYGCYIIIDHGDGVRTLYGHHSQLLVSAGEYVDQGQVIGLIGSTGRSTGPHLHFEIRLGSRFSNPLQYVRR